MIALKLTVNGREERVAVEPAETLLDVLRNRLHLTGTKDGCREGECGACTVLLDGTPIDACIYAAQAANGRRVETIEGLSGEQLGSLQRRIVEASGVQCGYCTPGIVMTLTALLREHPRPDRQQVRAALSGNLCRCTGYTQIVDAALAAAGDEAWMPS